MGFNWDWDASGTPDLKVGQMPGVQPASWVIKFQRAKEKHICFSKKTDTKKNSEAIALLWTICLFFTLTSCWRQKWVHIRIVVSHFSKEMSPVDNVPNRSTSLYFDWDLSPSLKNTPICLFKNIYRNACTVPFTRFQNPFWIPYSGRHNPNTPNTQSIHSAYGSSPIILYSPLHSCD